MSRHKLFVYQTLKNTKTQKLAMGHKEPESTALLPGYVEIAVDRKGQKWPTIEKKPGSQLKGDIIHVDGDELRNLDSWEDHYERKLVMTSAGPAFVYKLRDYDA